MISSDKGTWPPDNTRDRVHTLATGQPARKLDNTKQHRHSCVLGFSELVHARESEEAEEV